MLSRDIRLKLWKKGARRLVVRQTGIENGVGLEVTNQTNHLLPGQEVRYGLFDFGIGAFFAIYGRGRSSRIK
jgi:hypothetical protein